MRDFSRSYALTAVGYGILGMLFGIYMAGHATYTYTNVHVHVLLVGFATSFVYGVCHKLWLVNLHSAHQRLQKWQYWCHQIGTPLLCLGFLATHLSTPRYIAACMMAIGALFVFIAMIFMKILLIRAK